MREDMNTKLFNLENPPFNWKDLNGKKVRIIVVEDSGMQSVNLLDEDANTIYVISVEEIKNEA